MQICIVFNRRSIYWDGCSFFTAFKPEEINFAGMNMEMKMQIIPIHYPKNHK